MEIHRVWIIVLVASGLLSGSVLLLHFVLLDRIIDYQIGQQFALKNGSDAWDRWVNTPLPVYLKVYFFNVTNTEEVAAGGKPKLEERGPYVYRELRKKKIIKIDEEKDTVTYNQEIIFHFDKKMSGKYSENDKITVIHPGISAVVNTLNTVPIAKPLAKLMGFAIEPMFGSPASIFLKTTVRKLLFDGEIIKCSQKTPNLETLVVCAALQDLMPVKIFTLHENGDVSFAMLRHKNGSGMGVLEVNAGIKDPKKLGKISQWNGENKLHVWSGDRCNKVAGNDMALFTPYESSKSILKIFSTDMCSTVPLVYEKDINFKNLPGLKFIPPVSFLGDVKEFPENSCYCNGTVKGLTEPSPCLPKGALDLSACMDAPVIVTKPHFLDGDPDFLKAVEGLHPDPTKHSSFVSIEPRTGVPLEGYQRIQLNIQVRNFFTVKIMRNLPDLLFPVVWIEEGAKLEDNQVELLNVMLFHKLHLINVLSWSIIIGCIVSTTISIIFLVIRKNENKED